MRKLLSVSILIIIAAVLAVPSATSAQGPLDCCKASRKIKWESGKINTTDCTQSAGCIINKGDTVGDTSATCTLEGQTALADHKTEQWGLICLINTIQTIVDWVFTFLVVLTILFVILGAYEILTSAGSPEKITSGRNHILYAAIGLIVAFIARAVPTLVKAIMG